MIMLSKLSGITYKPIQRDSDESTLHKIRKQRGHGFANNDYKQ